MQRSPIKRRLSGPTRTFMTPLHSCTQQGGCVDSMPCGTFDQSLKKNLIYLYFYSCFQSFDAVGWAAGRASGLWKLRSGVLAWLCVWGTDLLMPLPLTVFASVKSRLVLPFWYQLTRVVLEKGLLNGCVLFIFLCSVAYNVKGWQKLDWIQHSIYIFLVCLFIYYMNSWIFKRFTQPAVQMSTLYNWLRNQLFCTTGCKLYTAL